MDNAVVLLLLRAIHIVGGVLWVGGVVFVTFFLVPATQARGERVGLDDVATRLEQHGGGAFRDDGRERN